MLVSSVMVNVIDPSKPIVVNDDVDSFKNLHRQLEHFRVSRICQQTGCSEFVTEELYYVTFQTWSAQSFLMRTCNAYTTEVMLIELSCDLHYTGVM